MSKDTIYKMNQLMTQGWCKEGKDWVDPITGSVHSFKVAYKIHLQYEEDALSE